MLGDMGGVYVFSKDALGLPLDILERLYAGNTSRLLGL
jgi:hypothetical protein